MDDMAIKTRGLKKAFGAVEAVAGVDLDVRKGEIFGLVGPDGAGKTTVMRLLAGILDPTGGESTVLGHRLPEEAERIKERTGYMPQRFGLYEDLSVMENIRFYADIYDVPSGLRPERIERLLGFSNMTPFKTRLAGKLSGGMKQKLGLACALVHTPELLFLDEPTNGVDPVSRRDFWRILYDLVREGLTVFISTSYLDEAERCSKVALMDRGSVLAVDEPSALKESMGFAMIELWTGMSRAAAGVVRTMEGVKGVSVYGDRLHVALDEEESLGALLKRLADEGMEIKDYRRIVPSLEDVFISMVGER